MSTLLMIIGPVGMIVYYGLKTSTSKPMKEEHLVWITITIVGLLCAAWLAFAPTAKLTDDEKAQQLAETQAFDARLICSKAIARHSRDPENADVPYVNAHIGPEHIGFLWTRETKMLRLRNGLGLEVATEGGCIVNRSTMTINTLQIDGRKLP